MNGTMKRTATISIWGAAVLLAVAGCTAAEPAATETATPSPTATANTTVTPSSMPSASETASEEMATAITPCADLLAPEEIASLTAEGKTLNEEPATYFDYPIVEEIQQSGLLCRWTGEGDVSVVVGQLLVSDAEWPDRESALLAEGFVADDASYPGFLNGPDVEDESYPGRGVVHSDGVLYYVSYPGILPSIVPLAD